MKVRTPLGIGYVVSTEYKGEVLVKLCKRDNAEWKYAGSFVFRMVSIKDVEECK